MIEMKILIYLFFLGEKDNIYINNKLNKRYKRPNLWSFSFSHNLIVSDDFSD